MERPLKILLLEDSSIDAEIIQRLLLKETKNYSFHLAKNKKTFVQALEEFSPDVILSDNSLPKFNSKEALEITRQRLAQIPFILVTGTVSEEFAADIIKQGADDYVLKDRMKRLPAAIDAALKKRKVEKEIVDYRYALDQSAIVAITDQKGIILYANENFCKISKYSAEELIGQDHRIINSGYHDPSFIRYLWVTIANGKIWRGEFRNMAKDGTNYWVDTTIVPFLDQSGKPYQYLAIRKDITEKKKAEENIKKNEEQYRDLVENITDLICTHDLEGRILSVNRAAEELIGHKFNPQENLNIKDILAPDKKDMFDLYISQLENKGNAKGLMKIQTFTGGIHIWEYHNSLKTIGVKNPVVRGYARDITESRKAEENLRQSEIRLNEAQALAHVSNWEIDLVKNNHTWSDEFYRIYGLAKDEIQPSAELFLSFMHPDDIDQAQKIVQEAFATSKDSSFEFRFIRKDGMIRHGYAEWRFEFNKKGNPIRLYGILQDITERKKAEEERKNFEHDLREQQRHEQLLVTATALESQEKERNAIGQELHDNVNQILVGTKLILSMVKNNPEKVNELIDTSIYNLQLAVEENRKIAHELVIPDFENISLVDQIAALTNTMLKTSAVNVRFDIDLQEKLLNDKQKLAIYRITQEQCTNIVKYAKATEVNIFLGTVGNVFKMVIADNGEGMKMNKKTGGIGLRNIKGRLSIFNGTATINSAPGEGFVLTIGIPLN